MTELRDTDIVEYEEEDPSGLYFFAWYIALHFDDFKNEKIMSCTFVSEPNWTEIVNLNNKDMALSNFPVVWEATSGNFTDVSVIGQNIVHGTIDLTDPKYVDDLNLRLNEVKRQLKRACKKYTSGNLINDPVLDLFFDVCKSSTCQIEFPDQTVMNIQHPKEDGILLYNIVRFPPTTPMGQGVSDGVMEKGKQQLARVQNSNGKGLEWARCPVPV